MSPPEEPTLSEKLSQRRNSVMKSSCLTVSWILLPLLAQLRILEVFTVKIASTDDLDTTGVVEIDADRIVRLKNVFHSPDSAPDEEVDDSWVGNDLTITITAKTASDMTSTYGNT